MIILYWRWLSPAPVILHHLGLGECFVFLWSGTVQPACSWQVFIIGGNCNKCRIIDLLISRSISISRERIIYHIYISSSKWYLTENWLPECERRVWDVWYWPQWVASVLRTITQTTWQRSSPGEYQTSPGSCSLRMESEMVERRISGQIIHMGFYRITQIYIEYRYTQLVWRIHSYTANTTFQ